MDPAKQKELEETQRLDKEEAARKHAEERARKEEEERLRALAEEREKKRKIISDVQERVAEAKVVILKAQPICSICDGYVLCS
jgi:multidrug resistance efflux pump